MQASCTPISISSGHDWYVPRSPGYGILLMQAASQIDSSNRVVDWVKARGYGLIDVNVMKSLPTHPRVSASMLEHPATPAHPALAASKWDP